MGRLGMKKRRGKRAVSLGKTVESDANDLIPGPKLRAKLGISAVTLWRWRHDEESGFPKPKVIKQRGKGLGC
jgi:predicted DNA-binding transcriptional regulator AlpA